MLILDCMWISRQVAPLLPLLFMACDSTVTSLSPQPAAPPLTCAYAVGDSITHLSRLGCSSDWTRLEGEPTDAGYGIASAVKFLYRLDSGSLRFLDTRRFPSHRTFAVEILRIPDDPVAWADQYRDTPAREFVTGTLVRYEAPDLWTMQIFPGDDLSGAHLKKVHDALVDSTWFGPSLRFLASSPASQSRAEEAGVPTVSSDSVYRGQTYQCMNPGEAYGTLVRAKSDTVATGSFGHQDIVLTDGIPNDLPVVGGIVTSAFQTPLSHVNVLSTNRGTPNMALRGAWNDPRLRSMEGTLVHLTAGLDGYRLEPASAREVQEFLASKKVPVAPQLPLDDTATGLVPLSSLDHAAFSRVGAKASNFGELARLAQASDGLWKVPEGGFAIPFSAYREHLRRGGIDRIVDSLLKDTAFLTNTSIRRAALTGLQERILATAIDPLLTATVAQAIRSSGPYTRMRFRSSTNAEDLADFNGAGLYSSYTGDLADPSKPIASAIRKVWASLWNFRAFEERQYYGIDQRCVRMGILVHRGFPDEGANGVALTRNLYNPRIFGYVINAQIGEVSVVTPPAGVTSEQVLYYPFDSAQFPEPSSELLTRSSLASGKAILQPAEITALGKALGRIQEHFFLLLGSTKTTSPLLYGMDVEFKLDGPARTLYIKQARPLP